MPIGAPGNLDNPTEDEKAALAAMADTPKLGHGYSKQQSTRPQTLGYGLVDSPADNWPGSSRSSGPGPIATGIPRTLLSRDELLDNVMVYWVTGIAASSARLYWESFRVWRGGDRVELPTGIAAFPGELLKPTAEMVRAELQHHALDRHAAGRSLRRFEQPELFVEDVRAFFATVC